MRLTSNVLFAQELETATIIFEGAIVRYAKWNKKLIPAVGVTYDITYKYSDEIIWNCGQMRITRLLHIPSEFRSYLGTKSIDDRTRAKWSRFVSRLHEDASSEEEHHQHVLINQFLDHIRDIPTIVIKLPPSRYKSALSDLLVKDLSDSSRESMMLVTDLENARLKSERPIKLKRKEGPGRPPMSPADIAWRRKIVQKAEDLKSKDRHRTYKDIANELGIPYTTLNGWRQNPKITG